MYYFDTDKLIEIFCSTDDFIQKFSFFLQNHSVSNGKQIKKPKARCRLTTSEIMTILVCYHLSGCKNFKSYYLRLVLPCWKEYFPDLVSYNRFIELIPRHLLPLFALSKMMCFAIEKQGVYYIDSKKMPMCDNKRIHSNKVFLGVGGRGKSSTGWFYGLKLHLIINPLGDIINFDFTPANVADNNHDLLRRICEGLRGKMFGDKGYLTKLFEEFYQKGLRFITKVKRNMKNQLIEWEDKVFLKGRSLIETVNGILKYTCDIDHTRHRSPVNAICHALSALIAYQFRDDKPKLIQTYKNIKAGC